MRPFSIDIDVADEDPNGYAAADAAGDAGFLTLLTTTPGDSLAHKVVWQPSGAAGVSGSIVIVGTDADGRAVTETLATNGANVITSLNYFATITSIKNSTVGAQTVDAGWADEVASKTYPLDFYRANGLNCQCNVTGTLNFDLEITTADVYDTVTFATQESLVWSNDSSFGGKSADLFGTLTKGVVGMRVVFNSYSSGAELQVYCVQPSD